MKKIKNAQIWGVRKTSAFPPGERQPTPRIVYTIPVSIEFSLTTIVAKWILHFALKSHNASKKKVTTQVKKSQRK